ncbi:MAG: putative secreted protein, partial [Planctomycetaceae bacterium]|nr:putative secreted protein [Planctomycetaceae bacterium]
MFLRDWLSGFRTCVYFSSLAHRYSPSGSLARRRRGISSSSNAATIEVLENRALLSGSPAGLSLLSYSTYLGGSSNDTAGDIATDAEGNTYVIGTTESATIAGQATGPDNGQSRAFITKFKPDGQIEYIKVLGPTPLNDTAGFSQTIGESVAVGPDDLPYVTYLSIEGEYLTYTSTSEIHTSKLSADGTSVFDTAVPVPDDVSSTAPYGYLAPTFVAAGGFAVDNSGNAYVTYEVLRPIKTADGSAGSEEYDSFITKLDQTGAAEFTNPLPVLPRAIAVDGQHNIYLTATTDQKDLPVSANALQANRNDSPINAGFSVDVYVAMLDPTASSLLAGTYLGGKSIDLAGGIAINPSQPGVVYLAGATSSVDFPLKNPFQDELNNSSISGGMYDGFITVLNVMTMKPVASTFLGGSIDRRNPALGGNGQDVLSDIALDKSGQVYVVGESNSSDFPVASPLIPTYTPGPTLSDHVPPFYDFVISKFDANLSTLEFSTYFGGSGQDSAASAIDPVFTWDGTGPRLALDSNGTMHITGTSKGDVREFVSGKLVPTDDFPI